jgi:single-strand DNA-binding protein
MARELRKEGHRTAARRWARTEVKTVVNKEKKMNGYNHVVLMGNLTREPTIRETSNQKKVADISLAVNDKYRSRDGEEKETVCFVDLVAWDRLAENCGKYLKKGSPIFVEGCLQLDRWTTQEGDKRSKLRVRADKIQFLNGPPSNDREE